MLPAVVTDDFAAPHKLAIAFEWQRFVTHLKKGIKE
jgi:hypothetical protein